MSTAQNTDPADTGLQEWQQSATGAWVQRVLAEGEHVSGIVTLHGGRVTVPGREARRICRFQP